MLVLFASFSVYSHSRRADFSPCVRYPPGGRDTGMRFDPYLRMLTVRWGDGTKKASFSPQVLRSEWELMTQISKLEVR